MKKSGLLQLLAGLIGTICYGQQTDSMIYICPDIQPTFKYDTCSNSLKLYFMDTYKMPAILRDNEYVGSVVVEFIVERDSSINNVKLIRGIDDPLDLSVL